MGILLTSESFRLLKEEILDKNKGNKADIDKLRDNERIKYIIIGFPYTSIYPRTMMVIFLNAVVTLEAMSAS